LLLRATGYASIVGIITGILFWWNITSEARKSRNRSFWRKNSE
jgi:uncharacterized iron-regulated membrane protein